MATRIEVLLWANRVCVRRDTAQPHELLEIRIDASLDDAQDAFHKIAKLAHPDLHRGLTADELEKVTTAYAAVASAYQAFRQARIRGPVTPSGPIAAAPRVEPPRTKRPSEQAQTIRLPGGGVIRSGATVPPKPGAARPAGAGAPLANPATGGRPSGGTQPPPVVHAVPTKPASGPITKPAGSSPSQPLPKTDKGDNEFSGPEPGTNPAMTMAPKALLHYRKAEMALRRGDLRGAVLSLKLAVAADPTSTFLRQALAQVEQELKQG